MTFASVESWLDDARTRLDRLTPEQAARAVEAGAVLVDVRPEWQRRADGEVPGSVIVESNHVPWRLHPESEARLSIAVPGQAWIVLCTEGYTSSLVADWLVGLGLPATDVVGGLHAWRRAGLPTTVGPTPIEHRVAETGGAAVPVGRVGTARH
jgi:rhodanese-related sulfurtransferase